MLNRLVFSPRDNLIVGGKKVGTLKALNGSTAALNEYHGESIKAIRVASVALTQQQAVSLPSYESARTAIGARAVGKEQLLPKVPEGNLVDNKNKISYDSAMVAGFGQEAEQIALVGKKTASSNNKKKKKSLIAGAAALVTTCFQPTANTQNTDSDEVVVKVDKAMPEKKKKKEKKAKKILRQILHFGSKKKDAPGATVDNEEKKKEEEAKEVCTVEDLVEKKESVDACLDAVGTTTAASGTADGEEVVPAPAAAAAEEMDVKVEVEINVLSWKDMLLTGKSIELRFNYREIEKLEENWAHFDSDTEDSTISPKISEVLGAALDQAVMECAIIATNVENAEESVVKKNKNKKKTVGAALRQVFRISPKKTKGAAVEVEKEVIPEKKEQQHFAGVATLKNKAKACGRTLRAGFEAAKVAMMQPIR